MNTGMLNFIFFEQLEIQCKHSKFTEKDSYYCLKIKSNRQPVN
jgi:hypothetical protein